MGGCLKESFYQAGVEGRTRYMVGNSFVEFHNIGQWVTTLSAYLLQEARQLEHAGTGLYVFSVNGVGLRIKQKNVT